MTIATFSPSETYIRRTQRLLWGILLMIAPLTVLLMLGSPFSLFLFNNRCSWILIVMMGGTLAILFPIIWLAQRQQTLIWRASRVSLTDVAVERIYHRQVETIPYTTITQVTIWETRRAGVHTLNIVSPQRTFILTGYGGLNRLSHELLGRLTPNQLVRRKPLRFDALNPWHFGGLVLLLMGLIVGYMQAFGGDWFLVSGILQVVGASILLFARPQSRTLGKQRRGTEIVTAGFLLLTAMAMFGLLLAREGAAALWSNPCSTFRRLDWTGGCVRVLDQSQYTVFTNQDDEVVRSFDRGINQGPLNAWIGFWTPLWLDDGQVQGMSAAANRQRIAIWRTTNTTQDILEVWDIPSQSVIYQVTGYLNLVRASQYALSPDGRILAYVSEGNLTLWNIETNQQLWIKTNLFAEAVTFSPDGQYIITNESDSGTAQFTFWQVANGSMASIIVHPAEPQARTSVIAIHLSPDGRWFAAHYESPNYVTVWDAATGNMVYQFTLSDDYDFQAVMTFSPDSQFLIAGFDDDSLVGESRNFLTFWRLADGTLAQEILLGERYDTEIHALDVSPDGNQLAVGTYDQTFIFEIDELLDRE